jgi:hypothetical protein
MEEERALYFNQNIMKRPVLFSADRSGRMI